MTGKTTYSRIQIALHWATAALIAGNWAISEGMGDALDAHLSGQAVSGFTPAWHVWSGSALLVLVLVRVVVRLASGAPEATGQNPLAEKAAEAGHWLLYALMLAVPALGAASWFGRIDALGEIHILVMNLLLAVIAGHAFMAIFHHYVLKDGLLNRMIPAQ